MKKTFLLLIMSGVFTFGYSQAVVDNATIPVSITLNTILRLNVTAGGNIDFTVNTLTQYQNGIPNAANYTTEFTVASSIDYDVEVYAQDAQFIGSDITGTDVAGTGSNAMDLEMVGYIVEYTGTGHTVTADAGTGNISLVTLATNPSAMQILTNTANEIISSIPATGLPGGGAGGAGDIDVNKFEVRWELGTAAVIGATSPVAHSGLRLIDLGLPSDRYSTNVFLSLKSHD